jgi:hypothetical protein
MAYEVNFTNGTVAKLVEDGIKDSTYSVTLVGKNVTSYGEVFAENFIKLLENHANAVAPTNPVSGQLWFNTSASAVSGVSPSTIGVFNGTVFKPLGGANISASQPSSPTTGDLWFDTTNDQLKVYSGASFILVGPIYSEVDGKSGPIVESVEDSLGNNHLITKIYNSEPGTPANSDVVATISKDATFTLAVGSQFTGFTTTIKPGIQLSSAVSNAQFHGEATSLSGFASTDFLSAIANDTTSGTLGVLNDSGLSIGTNSDCTISVSGNDVSFKNITSDGDLELSVNDGGVQTPVITIDGATSKASVNADPSDALGIATKQYVDTAVGPISGSAVSTSNAYSDGLITTLKSGAGAGYDTFAEVETEIGNVASANISGLALKVAKAGDIMTGHLTLNANPTNAMHSATKQYVDSEVTSSGVSLKVAKAGDTMTGKLTLSADPTSALHASTKAYVDAQVSSVTSGASTNGYGTRTVSTGAPSGGSDGDIWYRY